MAAPPQAMAADFQAGVPTNSFWLRKEITKVELFSPFINTTAGLMKGENNSTFVISFRSQKEFTKVELFSPFINTTAGLRLKSGFLGRSLRGAGSSRLGSSWVATGATLIFSSAATVW